MAAPDPADLIAALTAVLMKLLLNQPSILLMTPSFNWNTMEQYDDFQLFHKSVESGSPFRIFQQKQPQELDPMQNPTQLNWNMCSISWATGNLTIGSQPAQLLRFQKRKSKLQPSWTTCPLRWIMQCHNTAGSINWKMFTSNLESRQMNSSTVSIPLLTDATSHQMRKRNRTSSTDLSEPSMTRNLSKSCSHLT